MEKIRIMVSSTVRDLIGARECIKQLFSKYSFVELIGAEPFSLSSSSSNPAVNTMKMAKECDLYILVLGHKFGMSLPNGKSATEIEYDAAYKSDPTKILVFQQEIPGEKTEQKQKKFIKRVCNYYQGYWRTTFQQTHELQNCVEESFFTWLKERASLGYGIDYADHFIRIALRMRQDPNISIEYSVDKTTVELIFGLHNGSFVYHVDRSELHKNFWEKVTELQLELAEKW